MRIQRMAFVQRDQRIGMSQQLFLLRSGHDLELECIIVDRGGKTIPEPIRFAYTLDDKRANQLDKPKKNSPECYDAWRKVITSILNEGVLNATGEWVTAKAILVGVAMIAEFGEPVWLIEENLSVIDANIVQLVRTHHSEKAR